jgi:hypothetical protein
VNHDLADVTIVGNHKGQYGGFNIVDPRPGTVHQWATRRDVLAAKQRGWWVADPARDGRPAYQLMADHDSNVGPGPDGAETPFPEYVHMVTSEENFRRLMDERMRLNRAQLVPNGLEFLENVSREEYETGRSDRGYRSTRFATREHGTYVQEGDRVIEHLTPRGVLREEEI